MIIFQSMSFGGDRPEPKIPTIVNTFDYSRVPLGVCAGIAPFNFPAMIPGSLLNQPLLEFMLK